MTTHRRLARTAGFLYLLMAVLGGLANLWIRPAIHVPGDAAATAANLSANPTLFRIALVADIAMATAFVGVGVLLYAVFRRVDRHAAGAMVVFVTVGAGMILTNLLFHLAAMLVATDPAYGALGSDELVLLLLDLHGHGYAIAGIFFGLWLLPLALLGHRSGLFPRVLNVLLLLAGVSWIIDTLATFLLPDLPPLVHTILRAPTIAEFCLIAYLLIRGVRTPRPARPLTTARSTTHERSER